MRGGSGYVNSGGASSWTTDGTADQAFKTYVSQSVPVVPEVSMGLLLPLVGLIAVAGAATVRRVSRRPDRAPR